MDVLPDTVEASTTQEPEAVIAPTTKELDERKFIAQLVALQKALINILFFLLTLYFLIYMVFAMWPLLAAFLGLHYLKKGFHFNSRDLLDILTKVGVFVVDLSVNIMVQIMRFVTTF